MLVVIRIAQLSFGSEIEGLVYKFIVIKNIS